MDCPRMILLYKVGYLFQPSEYHLDLWLRDVLMHEGFESPLDFVESEDSPALNIKNTEPTLGFFTVKLLKEGLQVGYLLNECFDVLVLGLRDWVLSVCLLRHLK